jgi:hypothetical protein
MEHVVDEDELIARRIGVAERMCIHILGKFRPQQVDHVAVFFLDADDAPASPDQLHPDGHAVDDLIDILAEQFFIFMQERLALGGIQQEGIGLSGQFDMGRESRPAGPHDPRLEDSLRRSLGHDVLSAIAICFLQYTLSRTNRPVWNERIIAVGMAAPLARSTGEGPGVRAVGIGTISPPPLLRKQSHKRSIAIPPLQKENPCSTLRVACHPYARRATMAVRQSALLRRFSAASAQRNSDRSSAQIRIAKWHLAAGRRKEARAILQNVLTTSSDDSELDMARIPEQLGPLYIELEDIDAATKLAHGMPKGHIARCEALCAVGEGHAKKGNATAAAATLQEALEAAQETAPFGDGISVDTARELAMTKVVRAHLGGGDLAGGYQIARQLELGIDVRTNSVRAVAAHHVMAKGADEALALAEKETDPALRSSLYYGIASTLLKSAGIETPTYWLIDPDTRL